MSVNGFLSATATHAEPGGARRAARQICRWREKEGMIKFSELHDFFRRFAQRDAIQQNVS